MPSPTAALRTFDVGRGVVDEVLLAACAYILIGLGQTVRVAEVRTVRNLQAYIYKRPGDATSRRVFEHVEGVHSREALTPANWDALLIPACSNPDADVVRWLLDQGSRPQKQLKKLLTMTVGWHERRLAWAHKQIAVLAVLAEFIPDSDQELLSQALSTACWFGNPGPAVWLIERGADTHYGSWNALKRARVDCVTNAQMRGDRLGDYTTYEFLRPWHEMKEPLGDWTALYD